MRRLNILALVIAVTALLAACGSADTSALTGKDWQLTAITEKTPAFLGVIPADEQSKYQINFGTDGKFHGTADCNQFAGTYKAVGASALTIDPIATTLAMCPEGSFDALFVHGLSRSKSWAVSNGTLTLTLDEDGSMTFVIGVAASGAPSASTAASPTASPTPKPTPSPTPKPTPSPTPKPTTAPTTGPTTGPTTAPTATAAPTASPPPASSGLIGKTWQLTAITEKVPAFQGVVPADQQANYTIQFNADGTFAAKADCNSLNGTYTTPDPNAASGSLALTLGSSTLALCPEGSFSDLYILGLSNAASYAVASSQLTITLVEEGTLVYK